MLLPYSTILNSINNPHHVMLRGLPRFVQFCQQLPAPSARGPMFLLMARPRLCPFVEHWPRMIIDFDKQEYLLRNNQTFVDMTKAATKPPPLRTRSLPPRSLRDAEASDAGQKREEHHDVK